MSEEEKEEVSMGTQIREISTKEKMKRKKGGREEMKERGGTHLFCSCILRIDTYLGHCGYSSHELPLCSL